MRSAYLCLLAGVLAVSCGGDEPADDWSPDPSETVTPALVSVTFYSALVAPVKPDGCAWDGPTCSSPDPSALDLLKGAIEGFYAGGGVGAVVSLFQGGAFAALNKPDPVASIEMWSAADNAWRYQAVIPETTDSFTADLRGGVYSNVPFSEGMRFRVQISDADLQYSDPIGVAELNYQALRRAWETGTQEWIPVSKDYSSNGVIGVLVSVIGQT